MFAPCFIVHQFLADAIKAMWAGQKY